MDKFFIRKHYQATRNRLSSEEIETWSIAIANKTLELPIWKYETFHLFLPIEKKKEVDTSYLLSILQGKDKNVVVSRSNSDRSLTNILLTDNTIFALNQWGIPEPQNGIEISENKLDVIFVPLLAFDKNGHRIGYGKGYYDTLLQKCNDKVITIGLSFFPAMEEAIIPENHDIPLQYAITPQRLYRF